MGRSRMSRSVAWAALAALVLSGCSDSLGPGAPEGAEPIAAVDGATLRLIASTQTATGTAIDLYHNRPLAERGPRMMELFVQLSGDLRYLRHEPLAASLAAEKGLVVQPRDDGTLRIVLFATTNTLRIASGPLARLWLEGARGTVSFVNHRPIFAPPEADQAIVLGKPLTVGGPR